MPTNKILGRSGEAWRLGMQKKGLQNFICEWHASSERSVAWWPNIHFMYWIFLHLSWATTIIPFGRYVTHARAQQKSLLASPFPSFFCPPHGARGLLAHVATSVSRVNGMNDWLQRGLAPERAW